jgi:acyl carrier protein
VSTEVIIEDLKEFITREFLNGKGEGLGPDTPLIEWGVIDSVAIVSLREFVSNRYGVKIPNAELKPSNLTNLTTIATMIERLRG